MAQTDAIPRTRQIPTMAFGRLPETRLKPNRKLSIRSCMMVAISAEAEGEEAGRGGDAGHQDGQPRVAHGMAEGLRFGSTVLVFAVEDRQHMHRVGDAHRNDEGR
jgi:hypothetical protein